MKASLAVASSRRPSSTKRRARPVRVMLLLLVAINEVENAACVTEMGFCWLAESLDGWFGFGKVCVGFLRNQIWGGDKNCQGVTGKGNALFVWVCRLWCWFFSFMIYNVFCYERLVGTLGALANAGSIKNCSRAVSRFLTIKVEVEYEEHEY